MAAPVERWQKHFLQERDMRRGGEIVLLVSINELAVAQRHRADELLRVPLAPRWNLRLGMQRCPRSI